MTVSFRVKLLASHALIALVVGAVTLVVVERQVSSRMERQLDVRLEAQARAVAKWMERAAHPQQLARRLSGVVDARVTIIDRTGAAVGDAQPDGSRAVVDTDASPPEVRAARDRGVGRATRDHVRYVAVAAPDDAVVRVGVPIGEIDETKADLRRQLIIAAIASVLVALGLAALVAGPLTRRLRDATAIARRIGAGDYQVSPPPDVRDEIGVLASALATAGAELRHTDQRRREFLANVAHEIRTPVTSIRGYAEILAREPTDTETSREFLHNIHRNALRIGQLVEDLLELEALEAGKGAPLDRDAVALAPVVRHVVETLRARAAETGAAIAVDIAEGTTALGDADAIERIVLNLVDNALRYGGSDVRITVAAAVHGDRVVLTVADSGPGVPAEHRARIFDRFQRGGATRDPDRPGSGLGLAIARELAIAMGGALSLTGPSTFALELPA